MVSAGFLLGCRPRASAPDTHEGRVVAGFCETIIPGAIDAGAPALFFDPTLPALAFVPLLVTFLDGGAQRLFNGDFDEISPDARDAVVEDALAGFAPLEFAVQLAKLAYFVSPDAQASLGYPGANDGYRADPDFSFDAPLTVEITRDGNFD
jgi:hypothetical protein